MITGSALVGVLATGALTTVAAPATAATPWSAVTGTVSGEGEPLEAELRFYRRDDEGDFSSFRTVYADGSGAFSIRLPDGTYKLRTGEMAGNVFAQEWYDDAPDEDSAEEIVVAGGPVALDPIELAAHPAMTGRVVDDAGRPIRGVRVGGVLADQPEWGVQTSSYTDRSGRFRLSPGAERWLLDLYDPEEHYASDRYREGPDATGPTVLTYTDEETIDVGDVRMSTGGSVSGRVSDPAGTALAAIDVFLLDSAERTVGWATTDRSGAYHVPRVAPGTYTLSFSDNRGGELMDTRTSVPLVLARDQVVTGVDAVMTPRVPGEPGSAVDLTGLVVDAAGRPVRGIAVTAVEAAVERTTQPAASSRVVTDRTGRYTFTGLDPEMLEETGQDPGVSTFRLSFEGPGEGGDLRFLPTFLGGEDFERSATVTIPAGGTVTAPTTTLQEYAGVRGSVSSVVGPLDGGYVTAFDSDGRSVISTKVARDGSYALRSLLPGQTYRIEFEGYDDSSEDGLIVSWWERGNSFHTATPVTVTGGRYVTGVDAILTDRLTATVAPAITGAPVVGSTLAGSTGTWNLTAGTQHSFTWLRGDVVVGTGTSYAVSAADVGARLTLRVDGRRGDRTGTATSAPTAPVAEPPVVRVPTRTSVRASYAGRKRVVTLKVTVQAAGQATGQVPTGVVSVREGRRTVKARVVLRRGTATVVVKRPTRGRHTYTVTYAGSATALPSTGTVTVKVPKARG